MVVYGILGLINFILAAGSFSKIHQSCSSNIVRDGLTVILTISAILITVAVSYMFCNWRTGECYTNNSDNEASEMYAYLSAGISSVQIAVLGAVIPQLKGGCVGEQADATKKDKDNGKTLKINIWMMMVFSCITLMGSLSALWYTSNYIPPMMKGKKQKKTNEDDDLFGDIWSLFPRSDRKEER